jgi:predicted acylesterase/phospholipase RssA
LTQGKDFTGAAMTDNAHIDPDDVGRRFCDLVMKGGITSGVVFPRLVSRLSGQYRFRNIGGTSAGAIAAAAAAAAEFRRATDETNPEYGFAQLERLADFLGERPDGAHSRLFRLFRPEPATRKHFAILEAMLNRERPSTRALRGTLATLRRFPVAAVAGALPGVILLIASRDSTPIGVTATVLACAVIVIGAIVATVATAAISLVRTLPRQDFGLTRGHVADQNPGDSPSLTDWLHAYLQDLAGRTSQHPLTFGDLDAVVLDEARGIRGINLQMLTTALSMGRPFSLPLRDEQFYFSTAELARHFPADVIDWMAANPGPRSPAVSARDEAMAAFGYRPFPGRETLPVVVAVRMSLSFPLLLAAIPLHRYAWESALGRARDDDAEGESNVVDHPAQTAFSAGNVRKVLFSDGGICSNFPVHLFDAIVPAWPTFGVNLRDDLPARAGDAERAYLPQRGTSLPPENYVIGERGADALISFAGAIVRTMQNWRDNLQRAAPGFRDRVVTIRHTRDEGGLNLDMEAHAIEAMAQSGALGAQELIDAFARPAGPDEDHFTYHRWVRVRSLLGVLQGMLREIDDGVTVLENHPPYPDLIRDAPAYVGASYRLSELARVTAAELLDRLDRLDRELDAAGVDYAKTAPKPEVELRIQPVV